MLPRNLPHWVISLTLPLSGMTFTACAGDQEAGEMDEFSEGDGSEAISEGDASKKKKKKKLNKKKKKKKTKGMKGAKKKKKSTKQAPAEAPEQGLEEM